MAPTLAVAVDIGGSKVLLRAEDAAGAMVHEERATTSKGTTGAELDELIGRFLGAVGRPASLAVACPGLVDADESRVVVSDVLPRVAGWQPLALGEAPGSRLLNDVRAALHGAGHDHPDIADLAVVVVGTGIAAGFTSHGHVHAGADGWAGEHSAKRSARCSTCSTRGGSCSQEGPWPTRDTSARRSRQPGAGRCRSSGDPAAWRWTPTPAHWCCVGR